jgi:hypothetical protein
MADGGREDWGLPDYWLPRPGTNGAGKLRVALRNVLDAYVLNGTGGWVPTPLPCPAWVFLTWLGEEMGLMLHGSGHPAIETFTPRAPNDRSPDAFSKQRAVFATTDGIFAIFYAVLDRRTKGFSFLDAALQFADANGGWSPTHYYFSVSQDAPPAPWRPGAVYILPAEGFRQQPPYRVGDRMVLDPHFARQAPVRPLAKLRVEPTDFPFLGRVARHDRQRVDARSAGEPAGFPWREP